MSYRDMTGAEQQAFALRLRAFRKTHGLTRAELAAAIGMTKWTLAKLENCYERPYPSTVEALDKLEKKFAKADELEIASLEGTS